jgi:S1-C subfamily serine protease
MDNPRLLVAGQRLRLSELTPSQEVELTVELSGIGNSSLRPICLCLDADRHLVDGQEIVHQSHTITRCGGVELTGPAAPPFKFLFKLSSLSPRIERLVVAIGIVDADGTGTADGSCIKDGTISFLAGGREVSRFCFKGSEFNHETALCLAEFYRKDDWRLAMTLGGYQGGIPALLTQHSVRPHLVAPVERGIHGARVGARVADLPLPGEWPGGASPTLPKDLLPAVGVVVVTDNDGSTGAGTGFVISPGGLVLTCAHVVAKGLKGGIALGGSTRIRDLEFIAADLDADVALLYLSDRGGSSRWLLLSDPANEPALGHPLGILGYPLSLNLGLDVSYCEGIVNSLRLKDDVSVLQIDAGAAPGSSGAPVFSRSTGRVIGILTSGLNLAQGGMHINFATDVRMVWRSGWFRTVG